MNDSRILGFDVVPKKSQTISFNPLLDRTFGDPSFKLNASASSGLPVSLSAVSGPATLNGNQATLTGAGVVTIRASQPGNSEYESASPVERSFNVAKANQTISFNALPDRTLSDSPFQLSASASSGLGVSFTIVAGPASLSGNTVTLTAAGKVTIRASQGGNANFQAGSPVERSFAVSSSPRKVQSITFNSLPDRTFGDPPFNLSASSSSALGVSFSVVSGRATVSGSTVTLEGAGSVTIRASQNGNAIYEPAPAVDRIFNVSKATQTITFDPLADRTRNDPPFNLNAIASSGLGVSFFVVSGPATVSGNTVTLTGTGQVQIRASQGGDANYQSALSVDQVFTVNLGPALQAPIALAASSVSSGGFSANWTAVAGATGYRLDVATDAGFTAFVAGFQNRDVAAVATYPVAGLSAGTTYYFRLRAYNGTETSPNSSSFSVTTPGSTAECLLAYFPFDRGVADEGPNQLGGSVTNGGVTLEPGLFGQAARFTGTGFVTAPSSPVFSHLKGLTISCWIKADAGGGVNPTLVHKALFPDAAFELILRDGGAGSGYPWALLFDPPSPSAELFGDTRVPVGQWTHVAMSYGQASLKLFVNGSKIKESSSSLLIADSSGNLSIGGRSNRSGDLFKGLIDDVRIYGQVLTEDQVGWLFAPRVTVESQAGGASLGIYLEGGPSVTYSLQASSDLINWQDLSSQIQTTDSSGRTKFTVPLTASDRRFFRVRR